MGRHDVGSALIALALVTAGMAAARSAEIEAISVAPSRGQVDLRDLVAPGSWQPGDPMREGPQRRSARTAVDAGPIGYAASSQRANVRPRTATAGTASGRHGLTRTLIDVDGLPFSGRVPADPVGEVGPHHYVQMTNGEFSSAVSIFDKSGALLVAFLLEDLARAMAPDDEVCEFGAGDPIVLYDELDGRWLLTEFSEVANAFCVYISDGSSALGPYTLYEFPTEVFPDYPKYGVWSDTYLISTNEIEGENGGDPADDEDGFPRPKVYALDKRAMLRGAPAQIVRFDVPELPGFGFQALTPADHDGELAPPPGSPGVFIRHRDDELHDPGSNDPDRDFLEIFELGIDFEHEVFELLGPQVVAIEDFDTPACTVVGALECVEQPGTDQRLDAIGEVVMWRAQYRNAGRREIVVGNFTVELSEGQTALRWFELRQGASGIWRLHQEGTHAPDGDSRWLGSIAMDRSGNIAIGYSVSSASTFPSIRYAGREPRDARGELPRGERSIIEGAVAQTDTPRWGDYSSLNLDPLDGCTFWYTNEYLVPAEFDDGTVSGVWQTRIATFRFRSCERQDQPVAMAGGAP